jgi:pilus assembly protein CpaE
MIRARAIAAEIDRAYPTTAVIALHSSARQQDLLELMQLGIREVLAMPVPSVEICRAFERALRKLSKQPSQRETGAPLFAFLPARPGSGATTLAAHSAAGAARIGGQQTLLIDFDLRLGMTSFLFKLPGEQSVIDALTFSDRLEDSMWNRLVCHRGSLDILCSAPSEFRRDVRESGAAAVLDFVRSRYHLICVDLPGEMRDHELEALNRAQEVFLVCTPELGTLHMAKRKAETLQLLGVHPRVSVILNRADGKGLVATGDIEDILQLPVRFTVPSAEKEISAATQKAEAIEGRSALASKIEKIARRMIPAADQLGVEAKHRRFIEFFSITPVRERMGWKSK